MTFTEHRSRSVTAPAPVVWDVVAGLGGPAGWGAYDVAWRLRGLLDTAVGGPGMRGRPTRRLKAGDPVDMWRVEAVDPGTRLVLRTEVRMPGTAWMTLTVMPLATDRTLLTQDVAFEPGGPAGLPGRALWFAELPAHKVVFAGMLRGIAREAVRRHDGVSTSRGLRHIRGGRR